MRVKTVLPQEPIRLLEMLATTYFPSLRPRYAAAVLGGLAGFEDGFDEEMLCHLPGAPMPADDPLLALVAS